MVSLSHPVLSGVAAPKLSVYSRAYVLHISPRSQWFSVCLATTYSSSSGDCRHPDLKNAHPTTLRGLLGSWLWGFPSRNRTVYGHSNGSSYVLLTDPSGSEPYPLVSEPALQLGSRGKKTKKQFLYVVFRMSYNTLLLFLESVSTEVTKSFAWRS